MVAFLPLAFTFLGGAAAGTGLGGGGSGGLVGDIASPRFDFSRSSTFSPTTTTTNTTTSTFTDARNVSLIFGSPNARIGLDQEINPSAYASVIPTVIPTSGRDIGVPGASNAAGGINLGSILLFGGIGLGAYYFLKKKK